MGRGAAPVARWWWGLLSDSGRGLLDRQAPRHLVIALREENEADTRVANLHVWSVEPGIQAAESSVKTDELRSPNDYKVLVPKDLGLRRVTVAPPSS